MGKEKKPNFVKPPKKTLRQLTVQALQEVATTDLAKAKYPVYLDFSDPRFQLASIRGLSFVNAESVKELCLNENMLQSLDNDLIPFPNLKRLHAARNQLTLFSFLDGLRKLDTLDLSGNRLVTLPDVSAFVELRVLNLSGNALTGHIEGIVGCRKLENLDLSSNDFLWDPSALDENLGILASSSKRLSQLKFEKNPFCDYVGQETYRSLCIVSCKSLEVLDGITISKFERKESTARMQDDRSRHQVASDRSKSPGSYDSGTGRDLHSGGNDDVLNADASSVIDDDFDDARSDTMSSTSLSSLSSSVSAMSSLASLGGSSSGTSVLSEGPSQKHADMRKTSSFAELNTLLENTLDKDLDRCLAIFSKIDAVLTRKRLEFVASPEDVEKCFVSSEVQALKEFVGNLFNLLNKYQTRISTTTAGLLIKLFGRLIQLPSVTVLQHASSVVPKLFGLCPAVRDLLFPTFDSLLSPVILRLQEDFPDDAGSTDSRNRYSTMPNALSVAVPNSKGTMWLEVVEARNLKAKDASGYSDPFVVVNFETNSKKSEAIMQTLYPRWQLLCRFDVEDEASVVSIEVFDYDQFSENDFLGKATVSLLELQSYDALFDAWLPLESTDYNDEISGDVHVRLRYAPSQRISAHERLHAFRVASFICDVPELHSLVLPIVEVFMNEIQTRSSVDSASVLFKLSQLYPEITSKFSERKFANSLTQMVMDTESPVAFRLLLLVNRTVSFQCRILLDSNWHLWHPQKEHLPAVARSLLIASMCSENVALKEWSSGKHAPVVIAYISKSISSSNDHSWVADAFEALADAKYVWEDEACTRKYVVQSLAYITETLPAFCRFIRTNSTKFSDSYSVFLQDSVLASFLGLSTKLVGNAKDEAQLAILQTAFSFKSLSKQMIRALVDYLFAIQQQDIIQGRAELVLSQVIDSLNIRKLKMRQDLDESVELYICSMRDAIIVVITRIMRENSGRDTRSSPAERQEQLKLHRSCMDYLMNVDQSSVSGAAPSQCFEDVRQVLLNEEKFTDLADQFSEHNIKFLHPPLSFVRPQEWKYAADSEMLANHYFVERSYLASDVNALFTTVRDYVRPRSFVYIRILLRISHLLSDVHSPLSGAAASKLLVDNRLLDYVLESLGQCAQHTQYFAKAISSASNANENASTNAKQQQSSLLDRAFKHPDALLSAASFASDRQFKSVQELLGEAADSGDHAGSLGGGLNTTNFSGQSRKDFLSTLRESVQSIFDGDAEDVGVTAERSGPTNTDVVRHFSAEEEWRRFSEADRRPIQTTYHDQSIETHWRHLRYFDPKNYEPVGGGASHYNSGASHDTSGSPFSSNRDTLNFRNPFSRVLFGDNVDASFFFYGTDVFSDEHALGTNDFLKFATDTSSVGSAAGEDARVFGPHPLASVPVVYTISALLSVVASCLAAPAIAGDARLRSEIFSKFCSPRSISLLSKLCVICNWLSGHVGSMCLRMLLTLLECAPSVPVVEEKRVNIYDAVVCEVLSRASSFLVRWCPSTNPTLTDDFRTRYDWMLLWYGRMWYLIVSHSRLVPYFNDKEHFSASTNLVEKLDVHAAAVRFFLVRRVRPYIPEIVHLTYNITARDDRIFDDSLHTLQEATAVYTAALQKRDQFGLFHLVCKYLFRKGSSTLHVRCRSILHDLISRILAQRLNNAVERLLFMDHNVDFRSERLLYAKWVQRCGPKVLFPDTLFACTTSRVFLFRKGIQVVCNVCPADRFCPSPPELLQHFSYQSIVGLSEMSGSHVFHFSLDPSAKDVCDQKVKCFEYTFSQDDFVTLSRIVQLLACFCATSSGPIRADDRARLAVSEQIAREVGVPAASLENTITPDHWFISRVKKTNRRGKVQDRILVINEYGIFNFFENSTLVPLLEPSKSKNLMKLHTFHGISSLSHYEFDDGSQDVALAIKLYFNEKDGKKDVVKFYHVGFGSEILRLRCVRCLEKLSAKGLWPVNK
eukprot:ANDGO_05115.mRNA.1 Rho GTPase-activating protein gacEE